MKLGERLTVDEAMAFAISQAQLGAPFVSPNPLVGCVILNSNQEVIGFGHHQKYGEAHAEINALKGLSKEDLLGAHVVVTLEPCAHQGKTGSCAKKLVEFPIAHITYGRQDPFPQVSGKGAQIIQSAGISCVNYSSITENPSQRTDVVKQLERLPEIFLKNITQEKIFVSIKLAQSLDGKMSLSNGESKWITSPQSREHAHYLRACHDMLIVGAQTVITDDPSLDIRHPTIQKENKVLILDLDGKTRGQTLKVFTTHRLENVFWAVAQDRMQNVEGSQVIPVPVVQSAGGGRGFHLESLTQELWKRGIRSAMVEGGAHTISSFLEADLVDRIHLFQAPVVLGGMTPGWASTLALKQMDQALQFDMDKSMGLGPDFYWSGRFLK